MPQSLSFSVFEWTLLALGGIVENNFRAIAQATYINPTLS